MFNNFCFTSFDTNIKPKLTSCHFLIYQKEKCPTTGKEHLQGYCELKRAKDITQIKRMFKSQTMHIERAKGTAEENIAYCTKLSCRVEEPVVHGTPKQQGKRNDIPKIESLKQVAEDNPMFFIRYHKGVEKLLQVKEKPTMRDIEVTVLIGNPGTGKTKYVYDRYPIEDIYKLNTNTNNTLWFDGYTDQTILLIDDFKGWIKYTELLTILDRYPYRCQTKGSYVYAKWSHVYITSNYDIPEWYNFNDYSIDAIARRIKNKIYL